MENNLNDIREWLVIVNPNAGKQKGKKDWKKIKKALKQEGFNYEAVFTEHRDHAVYIAENQINKGYKKIIVVGGDGTLNEVVNGVFHQKRFPSHEILIGMITLGTGNDWGRMYHIPVNYKKVEEL